jgi:antirestriction protein ArdC
MRTYTATPEQAARTEARRTQFKALAQTIAALSPDERIALAERMPTTTIEGHRLSVHNACLVASQNPSATMVGGFHQWIKAGRKVKKGEHGLMIWAPTMRRDRAAEEQAETAQDVRNARRAGFVMVTVFDVSQTDVV